eukprot:TRINITY_DN5673_c0_g1_i5.p1 TRINITY_DN5673_c0_g1~~TRINITY_DN5673_c0_g1_i5.p1  ORF type:complete len:979 (-),score=210.43 TRINITY_DN5673_c0_g1_i5:217-3153(-)
MTLDKHGARNTALKGMLIRAWRERWTPSQFGTQIKTILNKSSAGEDVELADQIIALSANGPSPNKLLLDLLDHSLASQLTTYTAVLNSISRFTKYNLPHCTQAFLNLVLKHKSFVTCRGEGDDYIQFSLSLVSLAAWLLNTASNTISRLSDSADSKVDRDNLYLCLDLMTWLTTEDTLISCVLTAGKLHDLDLQQELIMAAKGLSKAVEQLHTILPSDTEIQKQLMNLTQKLRSQELSLLPEIDKPKSNLALAIQSLLSFDVVLDPTSDLVQLTSQLLAIMAMYRVRVSAMVCELTRCCIMGLNECSDRWDAFTLLKLNRLVAKILENRKDTTGEVYEGLLRCLQYSHLLDISDATFKVNIFEMVVTSFSSDKRKSPLISETECKQLLAARQSQLDKRNKNQTDGEFKSNMNGEQRDLVNIFKADTTLMTIIKTFEQRIAISESFENLLSVMFHIVKGSSFDLLLSAASANGTLPSLLSKLLYFNKITQESMGESNKDAQFRAALFDMTFLMLIYMVQCFSSKILSTVEEDDVLFPRWARLCMTEPGNVKPLESFKELEGTETLVDTLLQQVMQGEIRVQVIKWNQVCASVHEVMKEILMGLEMGSINQETYNRLLHLLASKMCCFPICIASWLVSSEHFGEQNLSRTRPSPLEVLDQFVSMPEGEDSDTRPFFAKRNIMMKNILTIMRKEIIALKQNEDCDNLTRLSASFTKLWDSMWTQSQLTLQGTKEMARLYSTGGTHWYVKMLISKLNSQVYSEEVSKCVDIVFSLMHIDLPACTLSLLINTIPTILSGDGHMESLCYPAGATLARLTVHCLAATLRSKNSGPYTPNKRKYRSVELSELCNQATVRVKLRKAGSGEAVPTLTNASQEQLIMKAHNSIYQMFNQICMTSNKNPKLEFVYSFIEESIKLEAADCCALLSPLTASVLYHLVRMEPARFPPQAMLRIFDTSSAKGRRNALTGLCLLRNIPPEKLPES